MPIGLLLRKVRKSKGFKAEDVADRLGVTTPTVTRWENGSVDIKASDIELYCQSIGITLAELYSQTNNLRLPILGTIRAGVPILAQQSYDGYIEIPDSIRADFALRVIGDSMIGVGIMDGDLALCRESDVPQFGRIIVALRDESSISTATLKFYFNGSGEPKLKAANPVFPDIDYKDGYRCAGIMVALLRQDTTGYQAYQDFLAVSGHEEWTEIIDLAHGAGLKISQVRQILEGQIEIAKRLRE